MRPGVRRRGATKVEYSLILLLIGLACLLVILHLGRGVSGLFNGSVTVTPAGDTPPDSMTSDEDGNGGKGKGKANGKGRSNPKQPNTPPGRGRSDPGNSGNDKPVGNTPSHARD
jgi:Flp pilus assembly pilin Flp